MTISSCSNCGSTHLFKSERPVSAGGGYAPNYLPGLGSFWRAEKFDIVICKDCGLSRFFASGAARERLASSSKWRRV